MAPHAPLGSASERGEQTDSAIANRASTAGNNRKCVLNQGLKCFHILVFDAAVEHLRRVRITSDVPLIERAAVAAGDDRYMRRINH